MEDPERRAFMTGVGIGALAFTVAGATSMLTARQARAQNLAFRLLNAHQAETIESLGETLVPGARQAGIAHFIDQHLSVPSHESLLQARIVNIRPPFVDFYGAAIAAVDDASDKVFGRNFVQLSAGDQNDLVSRIRQNKIENWKGPRAPLVYAVFRSDAVDVVYGTMEGYEALGIPYMPHIAPETRW